MYLLDTNVCIDFLLGRSDKLAAHIGDVFDRLHLSVVTVAELRVGSRTSSDPAADQRRIDSFVAALRVLPFDLVDAATYADIVCAAGVRRKSFDRLIAAQALAAGMVLVTRNEMDFADISGLRLENWT